MHPDILSVSVFGGFAYSDMPDVGVSFWAVTVGDVAVAHHELKSLSEMHWRISIMPCQRGCRWTKRSTTCRATPKGRYCIVEPADNIGGGAPGDLTIVLKGLLKRGIQNAGVAIADAEAVREF